MTSLSIRQLDATHLEAALTLSSTAGWNQQMADWRMLLAIAPRGAFGAVENERIVGTSIGIDYGGFGWIAMMLVDPAWRGRGLGRQLLEAAVRAIPADRPIRLDATPMGRPLYQSFGFEDEARLNRHVSDARSRAAAGAGALAPRPLADADLARIAGRDPAIFGGDRREVLEWARAAAPDYAWIHTPEGGPSGYCLGRHGRVFDQIGPVVAGDADEAAALVEAALRAAGDRAVAIDAFEAHPRFGAWLGANGFRIERPLFRMCRPGDGGRAWVPPDGGDGLTELAIFGPEFA